MLLEAPTKRTYRVMRPGFAALYPGFSKQLEQAESPAQKVKVWVKELRKGEVGKALQRWEDEEAWHTAKWLSESAPVPPGLLDACARAFEDECTCIPACTDGREGAYKESDSDKEDSTLHGFVRRTLKFPGMGGPYPPQYSMKLAAALALFEPEVDASGRIGARIWRFLCSALPRNLSRVVATRHPQPGRGMLAGFVAEDAAGDKIEFLENLWSFHMARMCWAKRLGGGFGELWECANTYLRPEIREEALSYEKNYCTQGDRGVRVPSAHNNDRVDPQDFPGLAALLAEEAACGATNPDPATLAYHVREYDRDFERETGRPLLNGMAQDRGGIGAFTFGVGRRLESDEGSNWVSDDDSEDLF